MYKINNNNNNMTTTTYQNEILKSTEISNSIKLDSDFNKSMTIIGRYSVLVQFIKLSDIMYDWFDDMYSRTNDKEFLTMKDGFVQSCVHNLSVYVETGSEIGLYPLVQDLKESMSQMFSK